MYCTALRRPKRSALEGKRVESDHEEQVPSSRASSTLFDAVVSSRFGLFWAHYCVKSRQNFAFCFFVLAGRAVLEDGDWWGFGLYDI